MTVEILGNENDIRAKHNMVSDVWAKENVGYLWIRIASKKRNSMTISMQYAPTSMMIRTRSYP